MTDGSHRLEENLGVIVASIPSQRGVFNSMTRAVLSWSKSLHSLLGIRATSTEDLEDRPLAPKSNRTRRKYYKLQEDYSTGDKPHEPKIPLGIGKEEE